MSALSLCSRKRRPRRAVTVLGKKFMEENYRPAYAVGILCDDERDQRSVHGKIVRALPGKEVKVLVI